MDRKRLVRDAIVFLMLIVLWFTVTIIFSKGQSAKQDSIKEVYSFYTQKHNDPALKLMDAALLVQAKTLLNEPRLIYKSTTLTDIESFYDMTQSNERQLWLEKFKLKTLKEARKNKETLAAQVSLDETSAQLTFQNESFEFFKTEVKPLLDKGQKDKAIIVGKNDMYSLVMFAQMYDEQKYARILLHDAETILAQNKIQDVAWTDALNFINEYIRIGDLNEAWRVYGKYNKIIPVIPSKLIKAMYQNDELRDRAFQLLTQVKSERVLSGYLADIAVYYNEHLIKEFSPLQENILNALVNRAMGVEVVK